MPKKSLAAQLAELSNPAPKDFDPEDDNIGLDDESIASEEMDGFGSEEENLKPTDNREPGRLLMKGDISLTGGAYKGARASRSAALDREDWETFQEKGSDDDGEGEFGEGEEFSYEEAEGEDQEFSDEEDGGAGGDEGTDLFRQELEEIQAEERELVEELKKKRNESHDKAEHARNQRSVYDTFIESRIQLQASMPPAGSLPVGQMAEAMREDKQCAAAGDKTAAAVERMLRLLLETRSALCEQNPLFESVKEGVADALPEPKGRKRKRSETDLEDLWSAISATDEIMMPVLLAEADTWRRKTQIASGALKNLKAINQSISAQVNATIETHSERFYKRTRLNRSEKKLYGRPGGRAVVLPEDAELFDDTDFYQILLQEFIEAGSLATDDSAEMSRQFLAMRKLKGKKQRKDVDRKASKGRKLRFAVMPQLVNFMGPIRYEESEHGSLRRLFA